MLTVYVTMTVGSDWHVLRPNDSRRIWCGAEPAPASVWTRISLRVPTSVCPVCADAEATSLAADVDRIPELAGVL
jgi:hypothetical protein